MRKVSLGVISSFALCLALGGCAADRQRAQHPKSTGATESTRSSSTAARQPAQTPGAAFARAIQAMSAGDESAYRQIVVFRPPCVMAEARARQQFASARLHGAVAKHGVTGRRIRDAGFDVNEKLMVPAPPTAAHLDQAMKAYRAIGWRIEGDVATMATTRAVMGPEITMQSERLDGGWVIAISDGADFRDATAEELAPWVDSAMASTEILNAATAQVESGKLRTIREVNDFIKQATNAVTDRARVALLAAPPTGPLLVVTDADTSRPVAGARVWSEIAVGPLQQESLCVTTDEGGRARFLKEPAKWIHGISVTADGYARHPSEVSVHREAGRPDEIRIRIGKPAIVEVMLVLPDERRAALSVNEGDDYDPAPPGLAATIEPKRLRIPIKWEDEPPELPAHNPLLMLDLSVSPHRGKKGVVHRVTHAQTAAGRELPVFRDAPPAEEQTFGLYLLGRNGFGSTVFVIGTLADARAAEAAAMKFQWTRNGKVLGPATRPASPPS